ncbi:zinc finger BED domain-containing protein 5-like [Homarus americanus]|uniref:zinc finger BED domain-containing protein 5-like n=1 Tax=Homarus americanus TaxID=6706 RepID=UPI001C48BC35|nr:zinc finger BED domain-containing protein 5-like [Homarus americanus]
MPQDQRLRPIGTWPDTVTDPGQETGRNLCSCRRLWIIFSLTSLILSIMDRFLKTSSEPATKKRKRSINLSFLDKYGVADVSGKGVCVMCSKELAEESLKPNKLQRHMETHTNVAVFSEEARKRILHHCHKTLTKSQSILSRALSHKERMEMFSYKTAFLIAQQKRPLTEGEAIINPTLRNFCEVFEGEPFAKKITEAVDDATLSNNTMTRRFQCLAADLKEQILEDFRNSPRIALAVDESTDITSQPQLLTFGRFLKESSVAEELLACISLETTTRGEDIFSAIDKFFAENNLEWSKVTECSMDGAPSMMGKNIGLRGILSRKHPHIKTNHCIIHRQSLASKDMSQSFSDVMQVVIAAVNT